MEQVFGQGGWDSQPCQPMLINSSGLYQELESDGSTMEDYSQDEWGNHSQDLHCFQSGEQELGKKEASNHRHTKGWAGMGFSFSLVCCLLWFVIDSCYSGLGWLAENTNVCADMSESFCS